MHSIIENGKGTMQYAKENKQRMVEEKRTELPVSLSVYKQHGTFLSVDENSKELFVHSVYLSLAEASRLVWASRLRITA